MLLSKLHWWVLRFSSLLSHFWGPVQQFWCIQTLDPAGAWRLLAKISTQAVLCCHNPLGQISSSLLLLQYCAYRSSEGRRGVQVSMMAVYKLPSVTHMYWRGNLIFQKFPSWHTKHWILPNVAMIAWHGALGHVLHRVVSCTVFFILLLQLITKATLNRNSQTSVWPWLLMLSSGTPSYSSGFRKYWKPHVFLMATYLQPSSHWLRDDYTPEKKVEWDSSSEGARSLAQKVWKPSGYIKHTLSNLHKIYLDAELERTTSMHWNWFTLHLYCTKVFHWSWVNTTALVSRGLCTHQHGQSLVPYQPGRDLNEPSKLC